ncbi:MAG TPA: hypothetical protein PK696_04025, partial [bacterium]|nr:hypothetical protein [bacterium]
MHEPIGLANAVSAADALHRHSADPEHREWRDDFLRLLLMMMYRQPPLTGLFQACGGLLYPAFKENVEVLWAIAQARQAGGAPAALPVRTILEHQFRNNLAYFDGQPPDA